MKTLWSKMVSAALFLWRLLQKFFARELHNRAAEIAYYGLMAIFPFFAVLTMGIAFLPVPNLFEEAMRLLRDLAPAQAVDLMATVVRQVTTDKQPELFTFSALVSLYMSTGAISSITRGLNTAFGLKDPRHYARYFALVLILTLLIGILLISALVLVMLGPIAHEYITDNFFQLGAFGDFAFRAFRWLVSLLFLFLAVAGLHWLCPATRRRFRLVTPGIATTVIGWIVVGQALRWYIETFARYDQIFGQLGTVIILLLWFYLMALVLLLGAQVDDLAHPEFRSAVDEAGNPITAPINWKLVGIATAVLIIVPLSIRVLLQPQTFSPPAVAIEGALRPQIEASLARGEARVDHSAWQALLDRCRKEDGLVDYSAVAAASEELNAYLQQLAAVDIASLAPRELEALCINAFNAGVWKRVIARGVEPPLAVNIEREDTLPVLDLGGTAVSLYDLEHRVLRSFFPDPRLHFVLNAGSASQPPLPPTAFTGERLDEQLKAAVLTALSPPHVSLSDDEILLYPVVEAFLNEFEKVSGGLVGFLKRRGPPEMRELLEREGASAIRYAPRSEASNAISPPVGPR